MDIQAKVKGVLAKNMANLGAVPIEINGKLVMAVTAEVDTDRDLMGGSREKRDLDCQFPTDKGLEIRKGMSAKADDKEWKVDNFRKGRAMTTVTLIEPNRIEE